MNTEKLDGVTILVVEDDPGIINLLESFLESMGATVMVLQSGKNVLQMINSRKPDLMVLDVVLPFKDGFTILKDLRETGNMTPVIMLTDKSSIDEKVKGLSTGADDYMTKPFSTRELFARIKTVLRRIHDADTATMVKSISIGSISINPASRDIDMGGGNFLQLTKTEFDLVHFLARKKEQVVEHTILLQEILGYKSEVETKALVMHIANIRKKFAKAALYDVKIETVAGVGYKMVNL